LEPRRVVTGRVFTGVAVVVEVVCNVELVEVLVVKADTLLAAVKVVVAKLPEIKERKKDIV